ncbi:MAG: ABC transporter ATP-binding protein [Candidatus Zixiibacteriota bacterium]
MSGLSVKNLSKSFGGKKVLDNISLELPAGELLVVLGPSGCGKSTLLRIIAGLEEADIGEVYIDDRRVDKLRPRDRNVALVFQNYSLYPHMSVEKNLAFPLRVAGVPKKEIAERVARIAEMLELQGRLDDKPAQLSGGQRQRVALGRAIIREPALFLLDEPLSNLDAELRLRMRQEIVKIQQTLKRTMLHVTHDQVEALTMADRIALLNGGDLVQLGSPEQLYREPATMFVAGFIGQPKINFVTATCRDGKTDPFGISNPAANGTVTLGIRPESIQVDATGPYEAKVLSSEYLGDEYVAVIQYGENTLTVSQLTQEPSNNATVRFGLNQSELLWFDPATGKRLTPR